ncbi:MAG: hypothetical protein GX971_06635 [Firmicutes bacterium]|nr:hypothetical protein [Bacillota bacterium]
MDEEASDDGGVFFRTREELDSGGSVFVLVIFNDKQNLVDLRILGIADISNPLKRDTLHELINELNLNYRFATFVELDGEVSAKYSYFLGSDPLDPAMLVGIIQMLLGSANESYPKFMKLQWGR